ncbi:MAG TPA: cytochrome C oxidase subunit II [Myxococcota bacterium]|nr:cytochrome C oxidase subunit II [Myxococcota bacterium]
MPSTQAIPPAFRFWHLPVDGSWHGHTLDRHLLLNLWIALGLFALANILLVIGVVSHRRTHRPIHKFTLEYLPLTAFAAVFLFLGIRANSLWATQRYTGAAPDALQVEVTGLQFAWYFRYPGADATFGLARNELVSAAEGNPVGLDLRDPHGADDIVRSQLVLPAGREVDLTLRAVDVIHGFAIPEMRLKQNAVPGMTQHIHFTPERPGDYAILCTQVCGLGHYRMQAMLRVLPAPQFDDWLRQQERAQQNEAHP